MKVLIKQILREELTSTQEKLSRLTKSLGVEGAAEFVGGIDRYINIMYGGDFEKFVKDNDIDVVKFGSDGMSMYFHPIIVELMGLKNGHWMDEKILGRFSYGSPNGLRYSISTNLHPLKRNGEITEYKVVGMSGDSGFGYSGISKRNTLGKRYRQQIFKQIIDKYNLQKYIK